ncbi:hypothetical protein SLA2020_340430 [Shorea laevis]
MRTVFAFLTLLSLLLVLFAGRDVVARKDIGGYWKNVMDSQPMPEAIQGRIHPQSVTGVPFAKDFDPVSHAAANLIGTLEISFIQKRGLKRRSTHQLAKPSHSTLINKDFEEPINVHVLIFQGSE